MSFQRATPVSADGGALDRLYRDRLGRLQRVMGFAKELARALRREFAPLWANPGRALPADATAFMRELDGLWELLADGDFLMQRCVGLPTGEAQAALEAFGLERLIDLARSVDGRAAALRARRTGTLASLGQRFTRPLGTPAAEARRVGVATVIDLAAAETARLARHLWGDGGRAEREVQGFARAMGPGREVLVRVAPSLEVLASALSFIGPPARTLGPPAALAAYRAAARTGTFSMLQRHWLPVLVPALAGDAQLRQRVQVALAHWEEARLAFGEAQVLLATARTSPPERVSGLLSAFDRARLRVAVGPLTHLELTFRGHVVLQSFLQSAAAGPVNG